MEKLVLEKVAKNELALWNHIFGHNGDVVFEVGGQRLWLRFASRSFRVEPELAVRISCENQSFWICLQISDSILEEQISKTFDGGRVYDLPEEIRVAAFEVIFEELLTGFESWKGTKAGIQAVQLHKPVEGYTRTLHFYVEGNGDRPLATGFFGFDEGALRWFSQLFVKVRPSVSQSCYAIPATSRLEAGRTRLALGELKTLDRLDLIKVDEYYPLQNKKVVLRFHPGISYWASIEENSAVVRNRKEEQVSSEEAITRDLDAVEIDLKFEIGEKQIPLGDLGNLKEGYTFELDVPVDRFVTIRANGRKIGCGELVQIDEHIGVRVLEVFRNATDQLA
jgi:type III secretion protein Q